MIKRILDVIIPTFNNANQLDQCIRSIAMTGILGGLGRVLIINNGQQPVEEQYKDLPNVKVISNGKNNGWEGGLELGLKESDTQFVCFQNDDTIIPRSSQSLYINLIENFKDEKVAAVGPITTCASGAQTIFSQNPVLQTVIASYLIYFTVMVRRKHLDELGGIDMLLPGGDDIDLSIRINKSGLLSLIDPKCFIFHHGFQTGKRVHGDGYAGVAGGWNSPQMIERTQTALIRKHGFANYFQAISTQPQPYEVPNEST